MGAILIVTVPDTIIRSEWRGEAHGTMPSRSTSNREANVAIISMAQHASPNVTGHTDDFLAQLRNESATVVRAKPAGEVEDALGGLLEQRGVLVAFRTLLVVLLPLLKILELRPDRRRDLRRGGLYFHSRIPSL